MSDFWMGVTAVPAGLLAGCVAYIGLRWLAVLSSKPLATVMTLGNGTTRRRRAVAAGVVFAGERVLFLGVGHVGFAFIAGQRPDAVAAATKALDPPIGIHELTQNFLDRTDPTVTAAGGEVDS